LRATHLALKALLICIVASMVFGLVMAMLPFLLVAYFVAIRPRQSELKARWHQHRGHRGPGQQHWSGHHANHCRYRYSA
jgi:hypothetical protein